MRGVASILTVTISLLLPGCGAAVTPDSSNPAQCIAVNNIAWQLFKERAPAYMRDRLDTSARQIYGIMKLRAAGHADGGQAEGEAFIKKYGANMDVVLPLLRQ
jgi:hypothetical protein